MIKQTDSRSDITLPLLIDYVEALLPSLTIQANASTTIESTNNDTELLWVVPDQNARLALKTLLKNTRSPQISTLLELNQRQLPERYELACFWLPTLSPEFLQQYIPLLMRYRDLYAAHLLIALDDTLDLKAYGFTPFDILNEPSLEMNTTDKSEQPSSVKSSASARLWQFNLYDYKQLPNWLNADYWANPENWGKHRW
ncbi:MULTISPECIES: DUF6231 family protein [Psychrobacter]|uniref:DUF6231 family protein n=1 Tax=Psychrobacter TaxID=497 RepID=UPI0006D8CD38|nr:MULTISPECIES: DUF6231 family protein [Psychrobacter]MCG3807915.1 hypothetical protein [Psychrobacter sp. Ps4]MCG3871374.1 hypothetical protein [Psychrobacter sp. Ps7]MDN5560335.1 DUF6231 family protein [Psychrobacter sp.]